MPGRSDSGWSFWLKRWLYRGLSSVTIFLHSQPTVEPRPEKGGAGKGWRAQVPDFRSGAPGPCRSGKIAPGLTGKPVSSAVCISALLSALAVHCTVGPTEGRHGRSAKVLGGCGFKVALAGAPVRRMRVPRPRRLVAIASSASATGHQVIERLSQVGPVLASISQMLHEVNRVAWRRKNRAAPSGSRPPCGAACPVEPGITDNPACGWARAAVRGDWQADVPISSQDHMAKTARRKPSTIVVQASGVIASGRTWVHGQLKARPDRLVRDDLHARAGQNPTAENTARNGKIFGAAGV